MISPWIDGDVIYGPNKEKADSLRTGINGKIKMSGDNLLSKDEKGNSVSGDLRVD